MDGAVILRTRTSGEVAPAGPSWVWHRAISGDAMACELPQRSWGAGITALRVGALVAGVAVVAGAIVLGIGPLVSQVAGLLFAAGWFLLAVGFGIPVVTAAEIGDPRLGKLLAVLRDRQKQMTGQIETRLQYTLTNLVG